MSQRPEVFFRSERGFSIVAAIFILVVLAGLGGFIVSTSSTQHMTIALDIQNARARQAASAGIEWGIYQIAKVSAAPGNFMEACSPTPDKAFVNNPDKEGTNVTAPDCSTSVTPACKLNWTAAAPLAGLSEFTVKVQCERSAEIDEGGSKYRVYQITSTACNASGCPAAAPGLGYVEHRQVARVKQ